MTEKAQKIWDDFCGELTQEPTEDMKEALATAFRKVAHSNEVQYHQYIGIWEVPFYADELYGLADELETLK